jgi:hypothetical protein
MKLRGVLLVAICSALGGCAARGEGQSCDARLVRSTADPYGYRQRGDRCEGIYVQEVGGAPLAIVSWTESFATYDLAPRQPLLLEWESAGGRAAIRLRAQSLRHRLYYQMDAVRPPGSKSYQWPLDLLAAVAIPKEEVGVVGMTRTTVGQAERDLYLPLRISQGGKSAPPGGYHLVALPGVELKEVFITLAAVKENRETILKNGEPLGFGYYPAERPIDVPVAAPREPGIYRLEIGATHKSGGASTADLWFYHAGNH